jgi:ABC-2 type transport system permease protein
MTARSVAVRDRTATAVPRFGGVNLTVLRIEIRRLLRNRRTLIFALVVPIVLFAFVGTNKAYALATTAGGAMVSVERAQGWSRQLRLTPLSPAGYVVVKTLTAMVLGLASVVAVFVVGKATGVPVFYHGYGYLWFVTALCVWIGALIFAALGLFIGYLLPSENVMQFLGLAVAALAFAGGLFYPLKQAAQILQDIAKWTPMYGVNQLVHALQIGGSFDIMWAVNAVAWLLLFVAGAVWRFRKDTARV